MNETVLKTTGLTKQYGSLYAVDNVGLTVNKGEIYGFIGENGAGKTTLIRMMVSLIHPSSGEISLFGRSDPQSLCDARKRIGCIVESPAFYPKLTARENLKYYCIARGIPDLSAIDRSLEISGLTDTGKKRYSDFSLGMKQRLGLALAIMGNPDFLILDEPINGLDPKGIIEFRSTIKNLQRENGMTIMISSHILSELTQVATNFGIIHKGRLIKEFSHEQLDRDTKQCIAVRVDNTEMAAVVLQEKLGTTEFEVLPDGEIRIYSHLDNPSEITFQLSTAGVRVLSAGELGTNLEDYFLTAINEAEGGKQNA